MSFCKKESTEECKNETNPDVVCGNTFCEDHWKHCQQCGIPVCGENRWSSRMLEALEYKVGIVESIG